MDRTLHVPASASDSAKRPKVLIVSDVLLYREGLCASLSTARHLDVVGSVTGAETLGRADVLRPDVIVLDASLSNSLALARDLRRVCPQVRVVGFGISGDEEGILSCAEAGLAGFVGNDGTTQDLISVVDCSIRGELLCSPRVAAILFNRIASLSKHGRAAAPAVLTRRELEIALLIRDGLSNKEIAAELRIGPATVKNYVHSILEKLNVRRRSAVAARLRTEPFPEAPGRTDRPVA
jgi:DNA-binding NarL/FixJ family response regulator